MTSVEFLLDFDTLGDKLKYKTPVTHLSFSFLLKNLSVPRAVPLLISPTNLESLLKEHDKKGKEIKTQVNSLEFLLELVPYSNKLK